jgi:hypothetical protein
MSHETRYIISCTRCKLIIPLWEQEHICRDIAFNNYRKNRIRQLLDEDFSLKEILYFYPEFVRNQEK